MGNTKKTVFELVEDFSKVDFDGLVKAYLALAAEYQAKLDELQSVSDMREELEAARTIIEQQNETIEAMDKETGKQTGNFIEHKKKKLEVRIPKFKVKGKTYTIEDLRKNTRITILGDKGKNREVGLTDYLLEIKSPILEIEE